MLGGVPLSPFSSRARVLFSCRFWTGSALSANGSSARTFLDDRDGSLFSSRQVHRDGTGVPCAYRGAVDAVFPGGFAGTRTSLWPLSATNEQRAAATVKTEGKRSSGRLWRRYRSFRSRLRARARRHLRTGAKQATLQSFASFATRLRARARLSLRRSQSRRTDTQRDRARARVKRTATRNPDAHRCRGFGHQLRRQRVELCHYERR